jgi:hydrogenase nickel incorporation protein HypB
MMCSICGCDAHADPASGHGHPVSDPASGALHYGAGPAGLSPMRAIQLEADVRGANKLQAARNRAHFAAHAVTAYNLLSSPGSGKTTLLCATIEALKSHTPVWPLAVIEGDQQTSLDAERIRATGASAIQINTGRGCHLDARMVGDAFERLDLHAHHAHCADHAHPENDERHGGPHSGALLFIENVGNLVCPALWDLGEAAKVVVLSVTEGEDKPLKYPDMFAAARLLLLNKIDLLPHVNFDVERCITYARRVNPGIEVLQLSATRGDGMDAWIDWLVQPALEARAVA